MAVRKSNMPRVNRLISQGADVINDKKSGRNHIFINLRIPTDVFDAIEEELKNCSWMSRTGWILDAIQNKIKQGE
jgi:hypothetical protein